jgi:hypothetical protein
VQDLNAEGALDAPGAPTEGPLAGALSPLHVSTAKTASGWSYTVWSTGRRDGEFLAEGQVGCRDGFGSCNAAESAGIQAAVDFAEKERATHAIAERRAALLVDEFEVESPAPRRRR